MTIAITGATGQLGRLAVQSLKNRVAAADILALARDPAKAADLGVEARGADYHQPETLRAALQGVDTLALISTSDFADRVGQHRNVVEAAKAAGVKRLIYTSILKADRNPMLLAADHKGTEEVVRASGLPATLLRNGWYTENYADGLPAALEAGAMIGAAAGGALSTAARADYAEAIAATATGKGHEGRIYELAGDRSFTLAMMAELASRAAGKSLSYNNLSQDAYADALRSFGLPEAVAVAVADADAQAANGWLFDDSGTLGRLIGRPTTPMADSVKAALAAAQTA